MSIISIDIKGGLGNILFQVATAYSLSLKHDMELIVDLTYYHGAHHNINKYKNNILRNIKFSDTHLLYPSFWETTFDHKEIPECVGNTKLIGYFQSEKYFNKHRKEILDLFSPVDDTVFKVQKLYSEILNIKTCSIHVRRGDYLSLPNHHPALDIEYYKKAIDIVGQDFTFLIFSDDINWCKSNFDFISNKIFVDNLDDFEELYLMSLCDNNIIANSSFSWWGAWLSFKENKKVIGPKKWFGPYLQSNNTKDLLPENWISID
jgi:hypothetical protein